MSTGLFNALIRTHHITSRKKVAALKAAAKRLECYALLKSGGVPGIMYVEGDNKVSVQKWVETVHGLRYKGYQLVSTVAEAPLALKGQTSKLGLLEEVSTVKEMSTIMEDRGLLEWWRIAMGFVKQ